MSYAAFQERAAAYASESDRSEFIRLTYLHLGGAVLAFAGLCAVIVTSSFGQTLTEWAFGSRVNWFILLAAFMGAGWIAQRWAMSGGSTGKQYLGLALYVVAEAIIFTPLLFVAAYLAGDRAIIPAAGILTLAIFGGLTATVFITKKDFSFLGKALMIASFAALGLIIVSAIFGFSLGMFFMAAMVAVAGGYVLYYTSNVLHHYPVGAHVAAALALFAALALLFYYVLMLFTSRR